jgi:hypothetical protein
MIAQLFGALAPRKHNNIDATCNTNTSSLGNPVARFGKRKFCWEARGSTRETFERDIKPEIIGVLQDYLGSVPGTDLFTLSLYMVGQFGYMAIPTIMFISSNEQSRRGVRKAMNESGIISQYPEFDTKYVNRDPGPVNMMLLSSGNSSESAILTTEDATEILYDASVPITPLGVPIYVRNSSSLRPATANLVRLGDRIFFQTVHHVFGAVLAGADMTSIIGEEDLVIDSDSETGNEYDNEAQVATTSTGSLSPNTVSDSESQYSGRSRRSLSTPTPPEGVAIRLQDHMIGETVPEDVTAQTNNVRRMNDVIAKSANFLPIGRTFAQRQPTLPSPATLSVLGRLVEESIQYDLALIEITNLKLEETLRSLLDHEEIRTLAYAKIAPSPEEDATVYTYTASGGRICGILSANASYIRLPTGTSFQKIYIVRLDGPLAIGDCGSAMIDANTGDTYGHLVAGCMITGIAYILAAGHTEEGLVESLSERLPEYHDLKNPSHDFPSLLPLQEQQKVNDPWAGKRDKCATRSLNSTLETMQLLRGVRSTSFSIFSKEWSPVFAGSRKPVDDRPFLDGLIEAVRSSGHEPEGDDFQLFMGSYEDDLTSLDVRDAIRHFQATKSSDLQSPGQAEKRGTAWLDDRTLGLSVPRQLSGPSPIVATETDSSEPYQMPLFSINSDAAVTHPPRTSPLEASSNERHITDSATDILQGSRGARCFRRYSAPLTADDLYGYLKEKQFDHPIYADADRRLIYVADPGADYLSALVKTARAYQQRSLQDAICKYIAMDTSIRVSISERDTEYQLEFHIPYLAMRCSQPSQESMGRKTRTHRGWMNISFLDTKRVDSGLEGICGVHQAQISVTICGTDNSRWTAYCFEDRHFDEDGELGDDEQTEIHQSDQIARGAFGAEDTIWDPREYFIRVLLVRMRQVHREWLNLVRFVESGIKDHTWGHSFFSTQDVMPFAIHDTAASSWIEPTGQLLGKLLEEIANTNDTWVRFTSASGDVAYFSDTCSNPRMVTTFKQLSDVFNHIQDLEKKLRRIAEKCELRAQTVNLRLASDSKRSAELTVYFISPFAIVSTFFAIPAPIIGFDRNILSFSIAILLYIIVVQALLFFWEGRIPQPTWWNKISRAKTLWNGDAGFTSKIEAGETVSPRRSTSGSTVWR